MDHCQSDKKDEKKTLPSCCESAPSGGRRRIDWLFYSTLGILVIAGIIYMLGLDLPYVSEFAAAAMELLKTMWWGIVLGIVAVGLMQRVPREYFNVLLGKGDTFGGLLRAALAGLLLDLCSHGILMVGAKLYERGASLAQVMTFLIASPWNSLTLTLILVALVGLGWTLVFIVASAVIAIVTGMIYLVLTYRGVFPENPHRVETAPDFNIRVDIKERWRNFHFTPRFIRDVARDGFVEGRMVLRWLFFGTILAALIRAFVSTEVMTSYFGPTLAGLGLTLLATTIIEVCSEGSTPIGAELVTRANAPGNGFTFLMAGVSTDYTEILVIREFSKSWKIALSLPLITVPQVLLLGWIMNQFAV